MNPTIYCGYRFFRDPSYNNPSAGQVPLVATKTLLFECNGIYSAVTDLQLKKQRRNKAMRTFRSTYERLFAQRRISALIIVADVEDYPKVGDLLTSIKRNLTRKGVAVLGYVWCRDVGGVKFTPHYHIMIATTRISADTYKSLYQHKRAKYDVELCRSVQRFTGYLQKKELYGGKRLCSYGRSRCFLKPKGMISEVRAVAVASPASLGQKQINAPMYNSRMLKGEMNMVQKA